MSFQAGSPSHDLKGLGSDRSIEVEPWGTKEKCAGGREVREGERVRVRVEGRERGDEEGG